MKARSIWTRPLLWIAGAGVGAVLLVALASVLSGSLAIAEQPGRSIDVPAVSVQPSGASTGAATPEPAPSAEPTSTEGTSTDPTDSDPPDNDSTDTDPTGTDPTGTDSTDTDSTDTEPTVPSVAPEVVPAQDPVVVDDHGGDNPDHDDDIGVDDSGGSSGSGRKSG